LDVLEGKRSEAADWGSTGEVVAVEEPECRGWAASWGM
jgi:hypothetical protein